ncbi:Low-density lipoprotein receptor domain class A [Ancylostoma ceylanicum]|uniref:Low-density lipoprotein receptor domain class A n=1 Tax=Ancylostoma ceylanicum TaxID=53326 RepID=A0A0D6M1V6_9BILA|nr:Low-density lipoprotein receptor domain class A [Ancylostoma ceylanicum]
MDLLIGRNPTSKVGRVYLPRYLCLPWQLDCGFGNPRCIPKKKLHDGRIDCYSGLDEGCPSHYFVCKDKSTCIEPELFQDGKRHCADGSDEPCAPGQFPCSDASKCIPLAKFQDGVEDCDDGSDEECTTSQLECGCGRTRCVSRKQVGDDFWDCEDGSDELFNVTHSKGYRVEFNLHLTAQPTSVLTGAGEDTVRIRCSSASCSSAPTPVSATASWAKFVSLWEARGDASANVGAFDFLGLPDAFPRLRVSRQAGKASLALKGGNPQSAGYQKTPIDSDSNTPLQRDSPLTDSSRHQSTKARFFLESRNATAFISSASAEEADGCIFRKKRRSLWEKRIRIVWVCLDQHSHQRRMRGESDRIATSQANNVLAALLNECANATLNDCDPAAICMDSPLSYECLCREGYLDVSADPIKKPGRKCMKLVNECSDARSNDCSPHAKCIDKTVGYTCRCVPGYADISPGGLRKPGRKCVPLVNECETKQHDCDPRAMCRDEAVGFSCHCPFGFADISPNSTRPGRVCIQHVKKITEYKLQFEVER